jgi:PKD repeat protein
MNENYKRFSLLLVFFSLNIFSFAQEWVEMMKNPNANFYEIQAAFENYWAGKTIQKGKGYKAFKRWEHYMEPRVYPSGNITLPSKNYTNYKQWEAELASQGIPKSTNGNWSIIGPIGKPTGGGAGRLNFIRFDPTNSNTIWVGAPDGGLWKTINGGTSWTTNTDQLTIIGVSDVAIDPSNTQVMYLATGDNDGSDTYSIGLLKSTDGGNTWNTTGLTWATNLGRRIGRVLVNPNNPQMVLVFASNGVHRSTNGGTTFSQVSTTGASDGEFKPGDPSIVYACGTTFRRSTDGGATWTAVTLPLSGIGRIAMAVSSGNSAYVYLLAANNTDNGYKGLMRSTNSGTSFTTQSTTPNILGFDNGSDTGGQGWYDLAVAVSPTNAEEVIIGGINHWRSTNGGSTWTMISHWYGGFSKPYVHADVHDIQFLPGSGSTILSANDGGFFKTTNSGSSWTDLSSNLAIAQQYRFSLSTTSANMILAGHQDNGTNRTTNLTAWTEVGGGDGMDCFIDRTNNNRQISSIYYGDYSRTLTGGTTFADITDPAVQGDWVSPIHQDPVDANIAYTGGRTAFYKTSNIWATSVNWTTMGTPPPAAATITEFAIAPSNNQVIYVLKDGSGGVSKSTNGGTSFTSCATPTTAASPTWVAVSNTDPNVVFVVYSGYSATNKVFKSSNGGTSWTNISTGLPNVPVNCIVYHNGAAGGDGIYIGTDIGVYYRDNSTNSWIDFSSGLPNCAVTDLEIYYATNRLRAATFGRGTWDSDLYSSVPTAPVASFTANNQTICVGQSVQFTNTSTGQPTSYSWSFTGGTPSTSTAQNPTVTFNAVGTYDVSLTVTNASGTNTSTQTGYITVLAGSGSPLPLTEGFTSTTFPPAGWTSINLDGTDTTWLRSTATGNTPTVGNSMVFLNWAKDDRGNQDEMRTPKLNFTGLSAAQMTFDVAYAAYNATYVDGLEVLITTDCGTTWTSLYNKTGSTVAAGNLPTAAATTSAFVPTSAQWRTETINLNTYINNTNVQLAFRNLAGYGNNLYVDNINITGTAVPTAPTASFTSTPTGTACTGQTVQYTSTSTGSPTSYSWTFAEGTPATSTAQNPTVTYSTAGTYNVSLIATNSMGSNTSNQTNYITINQTPSISGTTPGSRCGIGTVLLGASASTGTISWFSVATGGTALGTGTTFTTPSISVNTTYYAEVTSNGCTSARTAVLATINTNPIVNAPATQNVCLGSPSAAINFTGNSGNTIYNWTNSNTAIGLGASGTGNIAAFTPSVAGTATVTVTPSLASCTGTPVTFTINVNSIPTVIFDLSSVSSPCVTDAAITLPSGTAAGGTYSGTGVSGNTFNPATAGVGTHTITYSVTQNGCTGTSSSSIVVDACSELNENENNIVVIYPNPTSGLLSIQGLISDVNTIQLIDASGRMCKSWNASSTEMQIDLTEFAVGSYTLKFKGMNSSFIKRIEIKR